MKFIQKIFDLGTKTQSEYYKLYCEHNNYSEVARIVGRDVSTVRDSVLKLLEKASLKNIDHETGESVGVPEGFLAKKISTCFNKDGEQILQWVQSTPEHGSVEDHIKTAVKVLSEDCRGKLEQTDFNGASDDDSLVVYPLTDVHVGMLSWDRETGENQDLKIIREKVINSYRKLIDGSAKACVLANLGDYFHANNDKKMTEHSGNHLDVDGRSMKVFEIGIDILKHLISMALEKHESVKLVMLKGNHDDMLSIALRYVIAEYAHFNERLEILDGVTFSKFVFGNTLLAFHHGHSCKMNRIASVIATDCREEWGKTEYTNIMMGHIHHESVFEEGNCKVESFRAPCAKDSWHFESGYRGRRSVYAIYFDREDGECGRKVISVK